jgi:hypothetical protein
MCLVIRISYKTPNFGNSQLNVLSVRTQYVQYILRNALLHRKYVYVYVTTISHKILRQQCSSLGKAGSVSSIQLSSRLCDNTHVLTQQSH